MKKFEQNDLFINKIRAYPKVSFFVYNGKVFYNNTGKDFIELNSFLNVDLDAAKQGPKPVETYIILTENSEYLKTEADENIILE